MRPIIFCGFQGDGGPFSKTVHRVIAVKGAWYFQCTGAPFIRAFWTMPLDTAEPLYYCAKCSWEVECQNVVSNRH